MARPAAFKHLSWPAQVDLAALALTVAPYTGRQALALFEGVGTQIDKPCQISHNVPIGGHCLLAAQPRFADNLTIGDNAAPVTEVGINLLRSRAADPKGEERE